MDTQPGGQVSIARTFVFGAEAERRAPVIRAALVAAPLAPARDLLVCDGEDGAAAIATALRLKRAGRPFALAPLLPDPVLARAEIVAGYAGAACADPDELRVIFEAIAQGRCELDHPAIADFASAYERRVATLRTLARLCESVVVRSHAEYRRFARATRGAPSRVHLAAARDPLVPRALPAPTAREIVVWAPRARAEDIATLRYGLAFMRRPPIFVCEEVSAVAGERFSRLREAAEVLARATVIVAADAYDPGAALAFAERGFGICAPDTAGAHEYVDGVETYDPRDFASAYGAVSRARADRRTVRVAPPERPAASPEPAPPPARELVSLLVPAYADLDAVRELILTVAAQTHERCEILLAAPTDAADAAALARLHGHLRFVPREDDADAAFAARLRQAAEGAYYLILDERVRLYPDHVARLLAAAYHPDIAVAAPHVALRADAEPRVRDAATTGDAPLCVLRHRAASAPDAPPFVMLDDATFEIDLRARDARGTRATRELAGASA